MYEPDEKQSREEKSSSEVHFGLRTPAYYTGDTDRVNGEYHYKNGYTQKMYSDAHYVPVGESTTPPRYYTPPARPVKEPKERKNSGAGRLIALCLLCAVLGGAAGAGLVGARFSERLDAMEASLEEAKEEVALGRSAQAGSAVSSGGMTPSQIYAQACRQVVGISTEVTYSNFFGMTSSSAVGGTGFIVSQNGYIVTNYHVVEYAYEGKRSVSVMLHDGTRYDASIIGVDESSDVAVLKIDAANLTPVTIGDSDALSVGDDIYAVGNPLGELDFSMSSGHVSALNRLITTEANTEAINMFQVDAAVNSGNSGGPAYNARGEVVGVVTAKYSDTGVEGIGFAIPINDAASIANDLITRGYVTGKAYMGIKLDDRYNSMYSQYYGMPIGAYVDSVDSGSCAEAAGIRAGDIITELGGEEITGYSDLKKAVRQFSAGDTAELTLYRAGESLSLSIVFDEARPDSMSDSPTVVVPEAAS